MKELNQEVKYWNNFRNVYSSFKKIDFSNTFWVVKSSILFFIFLMASSCNSNEEIKQIRIFYASELSTAMVPISCETIYSLSPILKKKKLNDPDILKKIELELKKLEPLVEDVIVDIRIKCYIDYKDDKVDTLCLGPKFNTVLNGQLMKDNLTLFMTIQNEIYTDGDQFNENDFMNE